MGMSAARCQGNVREFQSVWRVVTLCIVPDTTIIIIDLFSVVTSVLGSMHACCPGSVDMSCNELLGVGR